MHVQVKLGSQVIVPVRAGWTVTSSDTSILTANVSGTVLTLTALKKGSVWLKAMVAADLGAVLQVEVI
jgi:hypothetical protein